MSQIINNLEIPERDGYGNGGSHGLRQGQVPLLLKPNGVPVFQETAGQLDATMHRKNEVGGRANEMERTVKAHSFVVGKQIQNQTDITKCTTAEEQSMPVKVLYVKPGQEKPQPLVRAPKQELKLGGIKTAIRQVNNENLDVNVDMQLAREISMGDVSGIFKQGEKRLRSAPEKERKARMKAQKDYAEQIRQQAKIKDQFRKKSLPVPEANPKANTGQQTSKNQTQENRKNGPYTENRFQGQFTHMTKDLFRKAKEKVQEEKELEKHKQAEIDQQRQKQQQYKDEIKQRNMELIQQQKEKGGPGVSLKEKEEMRKQEQKADENRLERDKRREMRQKRNQEDKSNIGLDLINKEKLRKFQYEKMQKMVEEEAMKKQRDYEAKMKQMNRDRKALNKDLIDFAHPQQTQFTDKRGSFSQSAEDDMAQPIQDRKQILKEQQAKKKKEMAKKKRIEEKKQKQKEDNMNRLQDHLRMQKQEHLRKVQSQERFEKKQIQKKLQEYKKEKAQREQPASTDNRLDWWIEEQMRIENMKIQAEVQAGQINIFRERPNKSVESVRSGKSGKSQKSAKKVSQVPGNTMLPENETQKHGARENRYGLQGDNGYSEAVKEQRKMEDLLAPPEKEDILDFTNNKGSSPQSRSELDDSYDKEPVKETKRTIVNQKLPEKSPRKTQMPGVSDTKTEAQKQLNNESRMQAEAATVVQKWYRGWKDRKKAAKLRHRLRYQVEENHKAFTDHFKANDQFNLNRFLNEKARMRRLNQTEGLDIEESIQEQIHDSQSLDVQSYIRSAIITSSTAPAPQVQNLFAAPKKSHYDPLSLISIFAQKNAPAPSPDQMIPEREVTKSRSPQRKSQETTLKKPKHTPSKAKKPLKEKEPSFEDIEEEIEKSGDGYSSDFISEHITESIPSGAKHDVIESASVIEESIQESLPHGSKEMVRAQSSATQEESIMEEEHLKKSTSIEASRSKPLQSISEESHLQVKKPLVRIKQRIQEDFDYDGNEKLGAPLPSGIDQDIVMHLDVKNLNDQAQGKAGPEMICSIMLMSTGNVTATRGSKSNDKVQSMQEEILHNINKLLHKQVGSGVGFKSEAAAHVEQSSRSQNLIMQSQNIQSSIRTESKYSAKKIPSARRDASEDDISEDIKSEIEGAEEASIQESIEESLAKSKSQSEKKHLANARLMIGSEQSIIDSSKNLLRDRQKATHSVFDRHSFQDYTEKKFKDLLLNEGAHMGTFLDKIESAVSTRNEQEKRSLQKQYEQKAISPQTYKRKQRELEKWVIKERQQIQQKRSKVQDTCADLGAFMEKLERDKKMVDDWLGTSTTPRDRDRIISLRKSPSQVSDSQDSDGLKQVKDQLRSIRSGKYGQGPETKYINKKREFVRQLMKEKREAVDRGVKEKMRNYESELIDEMLQQALNLNVEDEVEKRIQQAKQLVEEGRVEESESQVEDVYQVSKTRSGKKNVKFQSPSKTDKYSSSNFSEMKESSGLKSMSMQQKKKNLQVSAEDIDDEIGESIQIEESMGQSASASKMSASASKMSASKGSKGKHSEEKMKESFGKSSSKKSIPPQKEEPADDENSLERDEDEDYSNEFIQESIASASMSEKTNMKSANALQQKASEIEESGYSDNFEVGASIGQSANIKKDLVQSHKSEIEEVLEEEDMVNESSQARSPSGSGEQEASADDRSAPSPPLQQIARPSEISEDREILESTRSVEWQITLQDKKEPQVEESQHSAVEEQEEYAESDVEEEEIEDEIDADNLQDLESCPSGSLVASRPEESSDFDLKVDQITDELMQQILNDFKRDANVKMEVEDIDEEEFEDKWPYSLDKKKPEEPPQEFKPPTPAAPAHDPHAEQKELENEAKRKHDELMQKYHSEQKVIQEQHMKVQEYLDFIIEVVDKEVLQIALQKPIEHDPLKILEKIQAFDIDDENDITNLCYSQQQSALPPDLFDEIEKRWEEVHGSKSDGGDEKAKPNTNLSGISQEARNIHHLGIFDSFNEALDLERPYKFKGLPNPWSRQTRVTNETLTQEQVDAIIKKARDRVIEWDKTGAGTKFAPPPPPPPMQSEYDPINPPENQNMNEEERNKAERQERLGLLLTKEVHQREGDWLDYEIEDTQVRFDLADMILEELAEEAMQFLVERENPSLEPEE